MLLAVMQAHAQAMDVAANLSAIDAAAQNAAEAGAEVLLTPELFTVGYAPLQLRRELDPASLPGLHEQLRQMAARHRVALAYSLPAVDGNGWHIGSTFVDETGTELAGYTKVHLFGPEEKEVFTPGTEPPTVFDYHGWRLGMMICFDVEFPEAVHAAAVRGTQLLLVPTALGHGFEAVATGLVPTRAMENQLFIAYANHADSREDAGLGGSSVIADPFGVTLAVAGEGPQLLLADIDPEAIGRSRAEVDYATERRVDLYRRWGL